MTNIHLTKHNGIHDKPSSFKFSPNTVIIVGNGAIEGDGWEPVKSVFYENPISNFTFKQNESYCELDPAIRLAQIAYFSRMLFSEMFEDRDVLDVSGFIAKAADRDKELHRLNNFRKRLADNYLEIMNLNKIRLRKLPATILNALNNFDTGVITTNWDELIWNDHRFTNVIQLHGRVSAPGTIILPTENMIDDHTIRSIYNNSFNGTNSSTKDEILMAIYERSYRGEAEARELLFAYHYSRNWIRNAKNIIIYGLSGHIYDVELQSLFLGRGDVVRESITVMNGSENVDPWHAILGVNKNDILLN